MYMKIYTESLRALSMHSPVRVMVLRDLGKTVFSDIELTRGAEVELPRWVAEALEKREYVRILRELKSIDDINKIRFQEERKSEGSKTELYKLPRNFYFEVGRLVEEYRSRLDTRDPRTLQDLDKALRAFQRIFSLRLKKILYLVQVSENIDEEIEKRMTLEERVFYRFLLNNVYKWMRDLSRSVVAESV